MTAEQRRIHDEIAAGPRGGIAGPFGPWLHSPPLAEAAQRLGLYLRFNSALPKRLAELAILYGAAHWRAQFEWHVHARIAAEAGVPPALIAAVKRGEIPAGAAADERAVLTLADELYRTRRVSDSTYAEASRQLGPRGLVDLVGILGYYALVAMTLNTFAVPVPPGVEPPFVEP
jgi:4-carboxymuconolactone decarboxylase